MEARYNFATGNLDRHRLKVIFSDENTFQTERHKKLIFIGPKIAAMCNLYIQPNKRNARITL